MPILPIPLVQNTKHLSIDSNTTVVDHDDDFMEDFSGVDLEESNIPQNDSNCSHGNIERTHFKQQEHATVISDLEQLRPLLAASCLRLSCLSGIRICAQVDTRSTRLATVRGSIECTHSKQQEHTTAINDLEQLHDDLLTDQTALVDGWTVALAQVGLPSILSSSPLLLDQKTPDPGSSIKIIQDQHLQKATTGCTQTMSSRCPVIPAVFNMFFKLHRQSPQSYGLSNSNALTIKMTAPALALLC
ncbi:hypothetical protein BDR06DRAFT_977636 [Suillus hirtellus]|nr:hypothetical protein BDR06DRAFT_977636 [Suillus hirtellus]